jgi:hypothetical protein
MKEFVDLLLEHKLIFKKLHPVDTGLLGTRKKVVIYEGVDLQSNYAALFYLRQKSLFGSIISFLLNLFESFIIFWVKVFVKTPFS